MCGIVGIFSSQPLFQDEKTLFKEALIADMLRGAHSTGLISVDTGFNSETFKKAVNSADFLGLETVKNLMNNQNLALIGHNRSATKGKITSNNAHPFTKDHISMVHNGTLRSTHKLEGNHNRFEVDSEALCYSLSEQGEQETFRNTNGAFAMVWWDSQEMCIKFARNSERTLYYAPLFHHDTVVLASEWRMIDWLALRNGVKLEDIYPVEEHKLYSYDLVAKNLTPRIEDIPEYQPPVHHNHYSAGYHGPQVHHIGYVNSQRNNNNKGGDSHNPKHRETAEENILKEKGMKKGQSIQFITMQFVSYGDSTDNGKWEATTYDGHPVVIQGQTEKNLNWYKDYVGRVVGCTNALGSQPNTPSEILIAPGSVELAPTPEELSEVYGFLPDCRDADNSDTNKDNITETIKGPHGRYVTEAKFWHYVKDGCCVCADPITLEDSEYLEWTYNEDPICPHCIDEWNETFGFNLGRGDI